MIIFISGTGTDVGKSFVNMRLNALLMEQGYNIISIKPIETGILNKDSSSGNLSLDKHSADLNAKDSKDSPSLAEGKSQSLPIPCGW